MCFLGFLVLQDPLKAHAAQTVAELVRRGVDLKMITGDNRLVAATGANFGNMFSMAGASLFLPFLPLLPKQILLTNPVTDVPEMTIAIDSVDREMMESPRRWEVRTIRRFMLMFGTLSSVFDFATFALLLLVLEARMAQFRTAWFVESVVCAALVVLAIRTRHPRSEVRERRW